MSGNGYRGDGSEVVTTRRLLQFLITEFLDSGSLVAKELGLCDRETGVLGDRHGVGPLGLELLLQGGVLADGFEELSEFFLGHGSLGWGG